jgi:hypothetical protein
MIKKIFNNAHINLITIAIFFVLIFKLDVVSVSSAEENNFGFIESAQVYTSHAGVVTRVAPGELLPVSVKLSNFGSNQRVDILIEYSIFSSTGEKIYESNETVAVETTANFVKTIPIPLRINPGQYIAKSSIVYQDQTTPAVTEFPFVIERKILGLFQSDFILYGGITVILSIIMFVFGHAFIKSRRNMRFAPLDYSNIPHGERTFYEILSDTITGMRERVGDEALIIASNIEGFKIDKETGRVLSITASPSKVIATLVSEYEKILGKKVSFLFRPKKADL